jgi:two-component system, chemotaxis family, CheB/CheR fusion protein
LLLLILFFFIPVFPSISIYSPSLSELAEIIKEKNAIIEVSDLCEVYINSFQFRQVFNNLISNSFKFIKPGIAPHIKIESVIEDYSEAQINNPSIPSGKLSSDKSYCHIIFSDNGIGFKNQFKDQIFEVFQRLHGKEEYGGTGIGLAIVKKIVENHNGIITSTSELGMGARFDIYIPC